MSTRNIPFPNMKKIILNYPKSAAGICFKRPKNEFGTAVVNEPSVFEPFKFHCIFSCLSANQKTTANFHFFCF